MSPGNRLFSAPPCRSRRSSSRTRLSRRSICASPDPRACLPSPFRPFPFFGRSTFALSTSGSPGRTLALKLKGFQGNWRVRNLRCLVGIRTGCAKLSGTKLTAMPQSNLHIAWNDIPSCRTLSAACCQLSPQLTAGKLKSHVTMLVSYVEKRVRRSCAALLLRPGPPSTFQLSICDR